MAEYVSSCSSKKSTKITLRSQQNSEIFRELKCSKTLKKQKKVKFLANINYAIHRSQHVQLRFCFITMVSNARVKEQN